MTPLTQRFHQVLVIQYLQGARNANKNWIIIFSFLSKIPVAVWSPSKELKGPGREIDREDGFNKEFWRISSCRDSSVKKTPSSTNQHRCRTLWGTLRLSSVLVTYMWGIRSELLKMSVHMNTNVVEWRYLQTETDIHAMISVYSTAICK